MTVPGEAQGNPPGGDVGSAEVARAAGLALLARLGAVIEVVSQPVFTWLFGLATYGVYMVLFAAMVLVSSVAGLGLDIALQRAVPAARSEQEAHSTVRTALLAVTGLGIALAIGITLAAPWLAKFVNAAPEDAASLATAIRLYAWALPLYIFIETATSAMRARRAFGPEIRLKVFYEQAARLLFAVGLFAIGAHSLGLVLAHLLSLALVSLFAARLLTRYYDPQMLLRARQSGRDVRNLLGTGAAFIPVYAVRRGLSQLPPIILNLMLPGAQGAVAAGLYAISRKVASILQLVWTSFSYVMAPLATAQAAGRSHDAVNPIYGFATRLMILIVLPLAATLVAMGPEILLVFGSAARTAMPVLAILLAGRVIEALCGPSGTVLEMLGHKALPTLNSLVGLAVWLGLAMWLVGSAQTGAVAASGATGMAIAVSASVVVVAVLSSVQLYAFSGVHPVSVLFWRALLVAAAGGTALWLILNALADALPAPAAALILPAGLVAFAVCLMLVLRFGLPRSEHASLGRLGRWLTPSN